MTSTNTLSPSLSGEETAKLTERLQTRASNWERIGADDHAALDRLISALLTTQASEIERLRGERDEAREANERDRSHVAEGLAAVRRAINSRAHLREPGRGSYTYDDEGYQREFGAALDELEEALTPLTVIAADWSNCPADPAGIKFARISWKARAHAAEAERDEIALRFKRAIENGTLAMNRAETAEATVASQAEELALAREVNADLSQAWEGAKAEVASQAVRIGELKRALEPFAKHAIQFSSDAPPEVLAPLTVAIGDLRFAYNLLTLAAQQDQKGEGG